MKRLSLARVIVIAALCCSVVWPSRARAEAPDGVQETCLASFAEAQRARRKGRLLRAREQLASCAQTRCPKLVRNQCAVWLRELEPTIPSVVIKAKDAGGMDVIDVRVSIDGKLVTTRLDGRPLQLDPGPHSVRYVLPGHEPYEQQVLLAQGESRQLTVQFEPIGGRPPPVAASTSPLVWGGFVVGGVGVLVGAITGGIALSLGADFEETCPGSTCSVSLEPDYNTGRAIADVSTASFVVAGVGAAVGVVGLFIGSSKESQVGLRVTPLGAVVLGRF